MQKNKGYRSVGFLILAIAIAVMANAAPSQARQLVVLTSYPRSFYEPVIKAFEAENPEITVSVVNRNTMNMIRTIERARSPHPDIVWAMSPVAFEVLRRSGALATVPEIAQAETPKNGLPFDSPDATRLGFARFALGVAFLDGESTKHRTEKWEPVFGPIQCDSETKECQDGSDYRSAALVETIGPAPSLKRLAEPRYRGEIAMSSPARSGTTHLFVECILQRYGWRDGWALLSRIGSNLATVTARSFGVRDGVANKRFSYGITTDDLAVPPQQGVRPLAFARLSQCIDFPASLAITAQSKERESALAFVSFLRSPAVQGLIDAGEAKDKRSIDAARANEDRGSISFDVALAANRLHTVTVLFTQMIEKRRDTLEALWQRIDKIESVDDPERRASLKHRLDRVRKLLTSIPVTDYMAQAPELGRALDVSPDQLPFAEGISRIEQSWSDDFDQRYERASNLLNEIETPNALATDTRSQ
ncbi:MAG: extracellular solute-binding protein [Fulvimarina manganoxydans]|uniref:substrate-binding domain-containing protein n=1 Tax=Fulvimarina manganoxydans TaxID=937218 RepID=UPI002353098D|nr:substrate-binding domain-containing protein [Fulvimarina manganoxydans]MCK5930949.1 extracellular solute-binding protein [Fulvimarina manganoxydans]